MQNQCVTAEQIAEAFMVLLRAQEQSFYLIVFVVVLLVSAPRMLERLFDYLESRKAA